MPSVMFHCHGCGLDIDPDARVTRMVIETPTRDNGSIDPTGFRRDVTYAHVDHELWYTARGYRATERGVLRDLTAR